MVTTNDSKTSDALNQYRIDKFHYSKMKTLRRFCYFLAVNVAFNEWVYGFVNRLERQGFLNRFVKYYDPGKIDFPKDWDSMPCDLEARIGLVQLSKYEQIVADRISFLKIG